MLAPIRCALCTQHVPVDLFEAHYERCTIEKHPNVRARLAAVAGAAGALRVGKLESENAELRADVAALWQRLGDVLSLCNPKEHRSEKDQIVLSHAKQLHSRWTVKR